MILIPAVVRDSRTAGKQKSHDQHSKGRQKSHAAFIKVGVSARKLSQPPRGLVWYLPSLADDTHPARSTPANNAAATGARLNDFMILTWHSLTRASITPTSQVR